MVFGWRDREFNELSSFSCCLHDFVRTIAVFSYFSTDLSVFWNAFTAANWLRLVFVAFLWIDAVVVVAFGRRGWRLGRRRERRRRWRSMRWWSRSGEERLELRFSSCISRRRRSKTPQICLELVLLSLSFFLGIPFPFPSSALFLRLDSRKLLWNLENWEWVGLCSGKVSRPVSTNGYVCGSATRATQRGFRWAHRLTYLEYVLDVLRLLIKWSSGLFLSFVLYIGLININP